MWHSPITSIVLLWRGALACGSLTEFDRRLRQLSDPDTHRCAGTQKREGRTAGRPCIERGQRLGTLNLEPGTLNQRGQVALTPYPLSCRFWRTLLRTSCASNRLHPRTRFVRCLSLPSAPPCSRAGRQTYRVHYPYCSADARSLPAAKCTYLHASRSAAAFLPRST